MMRLSGFASGLDIDQMVKELMAARRAPLNKLTTQKTAMEWQREQYRELNVKMVDFRNNKLMNYNLSSEIGARKATVAGNTSAVSVRATPQAVNGTISVSVTQLAETATLRSADAGVGIGTNVQSNQTLKQLKDSNTLAYTNPSGENGPSLTITVTIGGVPQPKTLKFDENVDTLDSVIGRINRETGVTAVFNPVDGKLSLVSKATGDGTAISVSGDFFDRFNLTQGTTGKNALATVNGLALSQKSNTFTINGVELTLHGLSSTQPTRVTVTTDTERIMDTIKSFVKDYNELLEAVNKKTNEERYRKYQPLTAEQKKEMEEDEVKLWEEKARSGLLRRDSILGGMVADSRLAVISNVNVDGVDINITSLGITTGSWHEGGKLVINETRLRQAIEDNPEQVMQFFTQRGSDKSPASPNVGLFARLSNTVMGGIEKLSEKAGTSRVSTDMNASWKVDSLMGQQLTSIDNRIADMNRRLAMLETQYYKQFTAMETAINRFNSQASMFSL